MAFRQVSDAGDLWLASPAVIGNELYRNVASTQPHLPAGHSHSYDISLLQHTTKWNGCTMEN